MLEVLIDAYRTILIVALHPFTWLILFVTALTWALWPRRP